MDKKEQKGKLPKIEKGFRIGKLTVTEPTSQRKNGYTVWNCSCDCGNSIMLDTRTLQRGTVRDCGCETKVKPGQRDLTGQRFGRLVCLEPTEERSANGGSMIWRCKCDCGNECPAVSRQLLSGYKKSCGCLGHPPLKDFAGQRFGMLTVLEYAGKRDGMHRWLCKCDCGNITNVGQTLLQSGKTRSCGCMAHPPAQDLAGRQFGNLTAVSFEGKKDGQYYWRCICQCGRETVVRQNNLLLGKTKSCGCLQNRIIFQNMKFVDGTSVTALETAGKRLFSNNTSGHNGVYYNRKMQKWTAQIGFKRKNYYLGSYLKVEDAIRARQEAEEQIYGGFLDWYYSVYQKQQKRPEKDE